MCLNSKTVETVDSCENKEVHVNCSNCDKIDQLVICCHCKQKIIYPGNDELCPLCDGYLGGVVIECKCGESLIFKKGETHMGEFNKCPNCNTYYYICDFCESIKFIDKATKNFQFEICNSCAERHNFNFEEMVL